MRYREIIETRVEDTSTEPRIEGLPDGAEITDKRVLAMLRSGRYRMVAHEKRPGVFSVETHPAHTDGTIPYQPRRRSARMHYRHPDLSRTEDYDQDDEVLGRTYAFHKEHLATEVEPLDQAGIIYRGMSFEEYQGYLRTGSIVSHGSHNIGDEQKGLTYWSTSAKQAQTYANSFAPAQFKASFKHPCYVVAAHMPQEVRKVKGTGEDEVGVARAIHADEVVAVWEGQVYNHDTGEFDLKADYSGNGYSVGGGVDPSTQVVWKRIA